MFNRNRLISGGSINRNKPINFKFNGQSLNGYGGYPSFCIVGKRYPLNR